MLGSKSSSSFYYRQTQAQQSKLVILQSIKTGNRRFQVKRKISNLTEAYQVLIAILAEKYPHEIANLMQYAQTVQQIDESVRGQLLSSATNGLAVGDRKTRLHVPGNTNEVLVLGLDYKFKSEKQQSFRAPLNIDTVTVMHTKTIKHAPKKMHPPTFDKYMQVKTVETSAQN